MTETDLSNFLKSAAAAAKEAGDLLVLHLNDKNRRIEFKADNNLVTEMDRRSEDVITQFLTGRYPEISILAEEGGKTGRDTSVRWLIDPLDGTTSYSHGLPHFSVSIALEMKGEPVVGVVYNPCLGECFSAFRGGGAYLNGKRIRISGTESLKMSLVATGFPYDRAQSRNNNLDHFNAVIMKVQGIRRMGSAALDLCYTAAGRFDAFWEIKLSPWDTAAGLVILREAGGRASDFSGGEYSVYGKELLASNGLIHNKMINLLKGGK